MNPDVIIQLSASVVSILSAIGAVIWTVAKIKETTVVLSESLKFLGFEIRDLKNTIKDIDETQTEHHGRLSRLEALQGRACDSGASGKTS